MQDTVKISSESILAWDTAVLQCLTTAMGGVAWMISLVTIVTNIVTPETLMLTLSSLYWAPVRMKLTW